MAFANITASRCYGIEKLCRFAFMFESPDFGVQFIKESRNISVQWYTFTILLCCFVGIISVTSNSVILMLYRRLYRTRTTRIIHLPVIILVLSNIGMSCSNLPFTVWSCMFSGWQFSIPVCRTQAFLAGMFAFAQIGSLCLLTLQRYYAILSTIKYQPSLTFQLIRIAIVCIASCVLAGMPYFGVGGYILDGILVSCSFNYMEKNLPNVVHVSCMTVFGYLGPLSLLSFCYARIIRFVRANPLRLTNGNLMKQHEGLLRSRELLLTKCAAKTVACFCISWTPYAVISSLSLLTEKQVYPVLPSLASTIAKCSTSITALLYFGSNPQFYKELSAFFNPSQGFNYNRKENVRRRGVPNYLHQPDTGFATSAV